MIAPIPAPDAATRSARPIIVKPASDHPLRADLASAINGPLFAADLLLQRGVEDKERAREFFLSPLDPGPAEPEPTLLGLERAAALLLQARARGEKVVVHGDYDVDGVTATALLYLGLKDNGFDADWFLPNRFREGYGITFASVENIRNRGARWMVSVDTGMAAVAEIARARELGIGVILTDHHQPGETLPPADAVVNPNQPGCPYPNKGLAGVGVAYKLLQAVCARLTGAEPRYADRFLDFVALGSLADNAPLLGENRRLVKAGLKRMAASPRPGLRIMLERAGMAGNPIASTDVLFKITPLLNAAGRMGGPELSLHLLLAEAREDAEKYLNELTAENEKRRKLDQGVTEDAVRQVEADADLSSAACLLLASPEWHEGVIGIVASRLVERYRRPCFVLSIDAATGLAKGSGRTVTGFNLHKALAGAAHLLEKWGGHYYACGFTVRTENIAALRALLNRTADEHLADRDFLPTVCPGVEIGLESLDEDGMRWIRRFEPFGPLNELPLFYSENVALLEAPRIVGEKHLKMKIGKAGREFDAIGFNLGYLSRDLTDKSQLEKIAYYPEWNVFRGVRRIQLRMVAIDPGPLR